MDRARDASRARLPDREGVVERDGVRIAWEAFGDAGPAIVLLPTWSIVPSRHWKGQVPYLARYARLLTFDGRGSGRSDRPAGPEAYRDREYAADAIAVMEAAGLERATLVGVSRAARWAAHVAAERPDLVERIVFIAASAALVADARGRAALDGSALADVDAAEGWARYDSRYWTRHHREFLEFFFATCLPEPHSSKQIEDCIAWGLETTPQVLTDTTLAAAIEPPAPFDRVCCPALVVHGDADEVRPFDEGVALAAATGGRLVRFAGSGHVLHIRDPVAVNLLIREFACGPPASPRGFTRAAARRPRALFVSSPIGLGHARRDLAIATELRRRVPDLEIDWLAQPPVTAVLEAAEERIHPASDALASEAAHIDAEAGDHALAVFEAIRRMDEILVANFMVFLDVVRQEPYDLWIGDEAWEVDHFLHDNPELKTAPFVWLSDFVGWVPMPLAGDREAFLTSDLNAEMLEQIARFPRVRDRSIFIGEPGDVVPGRFGPGLPEIRAWTEAHFAFTGYITGFDPAALPGRAGLRAELGWGADERVCIVTVGGSGAGAGLLQRVLDAHPLAAEAVPGLRLIAVCGPRVDPARLHVPDGVEIRAYVPDLHRHLAACDLAIVHGGLATTMELTALRRPFLFFPLRDHFEQRVHVAHRLGRHRAGRRMDVDAATPDAIARAIAGEIGRDVDYLAVDPGGAARAAEVITPLL